MARPDSSAASNRSVFTGDHLAFSDAFRKFCDKELTPFREAWEAQGHVDRRAWTAAGEYGFLCPTLSGAYGGLGLDRGYAIVQMEELARRGWQGLGYTLHSEMVAPYILRYGTEAQKQKYLPRMASGEIVGALAMGESSAAGHPQSINCTATRQGGSYVLNGSKTFITNAHHADLVVVLVRTHPTAGNKGLSLFLVERSTPGFDIAVRSSRQGLKAQPPCELFFENVRLSADNLLGGAAWENKGIICLMEQLPWERMQAAVTALASVRATLAHAGAPSAGRGAFGGQPVAPFQKTRYTLGELQSKTRIVQGYVDRCIEQALKDRLDTATASMAKHWATELQSKVVADGLEEDSGFGELWDDPPTRTYADAHVQSSRYQANKFMQDLISRAIDLCGR